MKTAVTKDAATSLKQRDRRDERRSKISVKDEDRHDERRSNISVLDETTISCFGRTQEP